MRHASRIATLCLALAAAPGIALAQSQPAADAQAKELSAQMDALQSYAGEGKREFVARQLDLSPEQAAKFWPIFEQHQALLADLNQRRLDNILAYSKAWNAGAVDDAVANKLALEGIAIEKGEAAALERTYKRLRGVVPARSAVRYLQMEYMLRAVVRIAQVANVPYVP